MKRKDPKAPSTPRVIPDGWYPIHSQQANTQLKKPHGNDELGLARAIHPANMKVPRLLQNNPEEDAVRTARSSPRHRKLQQQLQSKNSTSNEPISVPCAVADAFAPNKSLRAARLQPVEDTRQSTPIELPLISQESQPKTVKRAAVTAFSSSFSRAARIKEPAPAIVPLHKAVRSFDNAVDASPLAESNQVAITELFLSDWMARFEQDRSLYKSIVLHAEVAFRELYRMTANLALPNDVVTAFACKIFDDITEHFGPYSTIMHVLSSELRLAIYAPPTAPSTDPLPYFAIVKHQKRILLSLHKDQLRRQDRNDFLRYEIDKVHDTFLQFLDHCALGLVRTVFREWYSFAVVSKRNSRKYVEYFSAWFGGSAKSLVPRVFLAWKHVAVETKVARLHEQLTKHQEKLAGLQKQIEELTVQRDLAQLESLAVRNDRKHAEDSIQRLHRKIQSASVYLEGSQRREALVAQEGQLRVEAVTFLPPLVLESLLRGFHNAGFLQPLHSEFVPVDPTTAELSSARGPAQVVPPATATAAKPSILKQCITAILHNTLTTSSSASLSAHEPESNSDTRSKSTASPDPLLSLDEFVHLLRSVKLRIEADSTAHLLFLSDADRGNDEENANDGDNHNDNDDRDSGDDEGAQQAPTATSQRVAALIGQFRHTMRNVRHQDEHYARHGKLFSSRMLEHNEISVVPHSRKLLASASRPALAAAATIDGLTATQVAGGTNVERIPFSSTIVALSGEEDLSSSLVQVDGDDSASTNNPGSASPVKYASMEQLELLCPQDLDLSPRHTRTFLLLALGQLVSEYGSLLFSPTDMTVFVRNRVLQKVMLRGIAGGKHATLRTIAAALPSGDGHEEDDDASCSSSSSDEEKEEDDNDNSKDDQIEPETVESPPVQGGKRAAGRKAKESTKGSRRIPTKQEEQQQHHGRSRHMQHVAPRRMSSYRGLHAPIAKEIDRGLSHLVTAYDTWNRLAQQLVEVEIVHARGTVAVALPEAASVAAVMDASLSSSPSTAAFTGGAAATATTAQPNLAGLASGARANGDKSATSLVTLRPRLQLHIEPLASGALLTAAKEKDRSEAPTTPNGSHRRSMSTLSTSDWSFHTSKIRSLSPSDTQQLTHAMQTLHEMIATGATQQRARDYTNAKHTLTTLRLLQWRQASELASQFTVVEPASVANTTATGAATTATGLSTSSPGIAEGEQAQYTGVTPLEDVRLHVFECVTFANSAIERLFSVEDQPLEELQRVQQILERKKHVVRHAFYSKHRAGTSHATTLEDLWHVVKVLRLPRDVRVLPTMRDEELVGGSGSYFNEQLFSTDDLAEVLLQLCNEQFLPQQVTPLSARVDFFVTHHLPFAMQNQSAMREIMHKLDVKRALSDHGQTLRTIFRRYCAKDKDLVAAAAAKRRAAIAAAASSSSSTSSSSVPPSTSSGVVATVSSPSHSAVPQGITKFMRLADWHDFIGDYKLLRARFTAEYATSVFRNVQEAESGLEDHLEMIYSEFCEAIVALSVWFFPDPFLRHATRVHQFIRRYLPVSPEDTRDHHV